MQNIIHFAHANGIPSAVYQAFFEALLIELNGSVTAQPPNFELFAIDHLGMQADYPVDAHWESLTHQLIDNIDFLLKENPQINQVIGVGHSLGGVLTVQAAMQRPDLFKQIILLDPPLFVGKHALSLHLAQKFSPKWVDKLTPAGLSARRRDRWDSREQARTLLATRGFFKEFSPESFDAYIEYGLQDEQQGGVSLSISKAVEVAIFRTLPSIYWQAEQRPKINIPVHLIAAQQGEFVKQGIAPANSQAFGFEYMEIDGGHMFPLQYPEYTAKVVARLIQPTLNQS